MTDPPAATTRTGYTLGLRVLADLLDAHPDLPLPFQGSVPPLTFYVAAGELATAVRVLGGGDKFAEPWGAGISTRIGGPDGLRVIASAPRDEVCERVVVGSRTVTVPDPDAPMVDVVEDVVEWTCPDSFLRPQPADVVA